MKIYLASRYSRREELQVYRTYLESRGHEVTSRWLNTEWVNRPDQSAAAPPEYRQKYAIIDRDDVIACDWIIAFTEPPESDSRRGGRHVEFGIAIGLKKRLIVIGPRENIFYYLPKVEQFDSFMDFMNCEDHEEPILLL